LNGSSDGGHSPPEAVEPAALFLAQAPQAKPAAANWTATDSPAARYDGQVVHWQMLRKVGASGPVAQQEQRRAALGAAW
jgi:hypothetical protein